MENAELTYFKYFLSLHVFVQISAKRIAREEYTYLFAMSTLTIYPKPLSLRLTIYTLENTKTKKGTYMPTTITS